MRYYLRLQITHFKCQISLKEQWEMQLHITTMSKDRDNDEVSTLNCSNKYEWFGWWFKKCYFALLTRMKYDTADLRLKPAPEWYQIYNEFKSLKNATMMFREKI